jgi:UDP-N-acetylglucosamine diphosphorylase / glucose-1-phosphate thymidylyltransferase / UDP-N-acetylgalactosamine diphosphorylase / glucosamine-1-phosphate N-acetyltransferase / galactosamine-1-phosphate N-acetyltransferase
MVTPQFTETYCREGLFPFTLTRHTADIRVGILTIRQKWQKALNAFPGMVLPREIPANIIPGKDFFSLIAKASFDKALASTETYKVLEFPWQIMEYNDWALRDDFAWITENRQSAPISPSTSITGKENVFFEDGVKAGHCYINATTGPVYISAKAEIMEGVMIRGPVFIGEGSIIKMGSSIYGATTIGPFCIAGGEIKNSLLFGYSNKAHDGKKCHLWKPD